MMVFRVGGGQLYAKRISKNDRDNDSGNVAIAHGGLVTLRQAQMRRERLYISVVFTEKKKER